MRAALIELIQCWRTVASGLPDPRTGANTQFAMADIALSAFAVFFTQCSSFLSFQQNMEQTQGRNNARSLFQVGRIPSDNPIRQTLDPVEPRHLFSLFDDLHQAFEKDGLLRAMRAVQDTRLITLDATWYFSSQSKNIHCPNCSCLRHAEGQTAHFHSAITRSSSAPAMPRSCRCARSSLCRRTGRSKQDCAINAAKRWPAAHATRYSTGNDTPLGDDLYAHQPFCRQVLLHGFHFLLTCKPASHGHVNSWIEGLQAYGQRHTLKLRLKGKSNRWEHHQYRWANGVPLTDPDDALKVNGCEVTVSNAQGTALYRNAFITDWKITDANVAGLVAAGRARWKIENGSNNVLKNRGYHLEHNFGHGKEHLASLLVMMNLLAFGLHTLLDLTDASCRLIRATVGARRKFFQHLEALTSYLYFETWERLMDFMMRGLQIGPYAAQKH